MSNSTSIDSASVSTSSLLSTSSSSLPITSSTSTTPSSTSSTSSSTSSTSVTTTTTSLSSLTPSSTQTITSTTTQSTPTVSSSGTVVVVKTSTRPATTVSNPQSTASTGTSSSSTPTAISNGGTNRSSHNSGGLSTGATAAIAVVIPVVVVAALVALGIWFWRRRKSRRSSEEQRRREVEEYAYNPNQDPRLPVVGSDAGGGAQMAEDQSSGYRGWGTAVASNRKASTTLSAGHTQQLSDAGSAVPYSRTGPSSSPGEPYSDGHSADPLMNQRDTMGSDDIGALGAATTSHSHSNNAPIRRGPSNASSAYSVGGRSEGSDEHPPLPTAIGQAYDYNPNQSYGYTQNGPYGSGYGTGQEGGMPIVRDVSARRNTRIQPGGSYQQGNSGIAQNF